MNNNHRLVFSTIAVALFVPGHMFGWAIEWAWLGFQFLLSLFSFLLFQQKFHSTAGIRPVTWVVLFFYFTVAGVAGATYGAVVVGIPPAIGDLQDLLRFVILLPLVLYVGTAVNITIARRLDVLVRAVILMNLATAAVLLLRVPGLFDLVLFLFREAKIQYDGGYLRIGIPFANPNYAALIFTFALSYFLFYRRSNLFAILTLIAIFFTGSRSGFIAATPLLLVAYIRVITSAMKRPLLMIGVACVHVLAAYFVSSVLEVAEGFARVFEIVEALRDQRIGNVNTAAIRFELMSAALEYIRRSPLFGIGPGRAYGFEITDSQLVAWPLMYGVPCALVIVSLFAAMFVNVAARSHRAQDFIPPLATGVSFFLMLATGDFMKNYRMFFLVVVFVHCMYLLAANERREDSGKSPSRATLGQF